MISELDMASRDMKEIKDLTVLTLILLFLHQIHLEIAIGLWHISLSIM